ncbi:TerD family protein [Streptomyces radicis]|uniref:TerD family protein n=1 Tax=Streptomyces radicis TaxID=1750517 RepID=A0A3A9VV91_9ACTN|nr:TerD family protein [Streptomyces radicis]RKN05001.1 TerD family protein [Streptomyces radicis]RKN16296.1 TerD family protein [Streptomyces radicis]
MSVELSPGEEIGLGTVDDGGPSVIRMGLGWRALRRPRGFLGRMFDSRPDIDLDASAVLFAGERAADVVYFKKLTSDDGSVTHTGDSTTGGAGEEDDESIEVDLRRVPREIDQIVFTVSSFTGQRFTRVRDAFCRVVDGATGTELARFTLAGGGASTARIMAKVRREGAGWRMTALGAPASGRTFQDLLPAIRPHL